MSETANWSYTNVATVKPYLGIEEWTGKKLYGEPYEIACTWAIDGLQRESGQGGGGVLSGSERVITNVIYTEDLRPKELDLISLADSNSFNEIKKRVEYDMSFFDEIPDVVLTT